MLSGFSILCRADKLYAASVSLEVSVQRRDDSDLIREAAYGAAQTFRCLLKRAICSTVSLKSFTCSGSPKSPTPIS